MISFVHLPFLNQSTSLVNLKRSNIATTSRRQEKMFDVSKKKWMPAQTRLLGITVKFRMELMVFRKAVRDEFCR